MRGIWGYQYSHSHVQYYDERWPCTCSSWYRLDCFWNLHVIMIWWRNWSTGLSPRDARFQVFAACSARQVPQFGGNWYAHKQDVRYFDERSNMKFARTFLESGWGELPPQDTILKHWRAQAFTCQNDSSLRRRWTVEWIILAVQIQSRRLVIPRLRTIYNGWLEISLPVAYLQTFRHGSVRQVRVEFDPCCRRVQDRTERSLRRKHPSAFCIQSLSDNFLYPDTQNIQKMRIR